MPDNITYQAVTLPPNVMERITLDDSPESFYDWFWEFMGVDIQNADIKAWDFQNALDMVDIAFSNILQDFKETDWQNVVIAKFEQRPKSDGTVENIVIMAYHVSKLWDMVRAKVYFKLCRARDGFTLRQITESKSEIKQHQTMAGYPAMGVPMPMQGQQNKRWGL